MGELNEAGLSAAEATLLNQMGIVDQRVADDATAITKQVIKAYFDNAEVHGRRKMRDGSGSGHVEGTTHKFNLNGTEGYITVNTFPEGTPGEVFFHGVGKDGSTVRGLMDVVAILISVSLQYGVPLDQMTQFMKGMDFEPHGPTDDWAIPQASSLPDYIARYLEGNYGPERK